MAIVRLGPNGEVEVIDPGTPEERVEAEAAVLRIASLLGRIVAKEEIRQHRASLQSGAASDAPAEPPTC